MRNAAGPSPLAEAGTFITELLISAAGFPSAAGEAKIRTLVDKWVDRYSAANANGEEKDGVPP